MKKELLHRIIIITITSALVLTSSISCKKNEDADNDLTPTPAMINLDKPPPPIAFRNMDITSDFEKRNDHILHSYLIGSHFAATDQVESDMYKFNWKDLDPAYDIKQVMKDYQDVQQDINKVKQVISDVKNKIKEVEAQIKKIEEQLKELAQEMKIDFIELLAEARWMELEDAERVLDDLYSIEDPASGLYYYIHMADSIANKITGLSDIERRSKMHDLENEFSQFNTSVNNSNLDDNISKINYILGKSVTSGASNLLQDILDVYILKNKKPTPEDALNYYVFLENIFMKAVHHQLKGLIIKGNFINDGEDNPDKFFNYKKNTFNTYIEQQNQLLINVAGRLIVNTIDLTHEQYVEDMKYAPYGVAPDNDFQNILGRALFVTAQLQHDADDKNPMAGGVVYVPLYYNGTNMSPDKITCTSRDITSAQFDLTTNTSAPALSQFAYTKWENSLKVNTAQPDNQWLFYNASCEGGEGEVFPSNINISIMATDQATPWYHTVNDLNFKVEVKWWNPEDPDPATATDTKTSTNTMQFGFFALRWLWGYQLLNQGVFDKTLTYTKTNSQHYTDYLDCGKNPGLSGLKNYVPENYLTPTASNNQYINEISYLVEQQDNIEIDPSSAGGYRIIGTDVQYDQILKLKNGNTITMNPPITIFSVASLKRKGSFINPESGYISSIEERGWSTLLKPNSSPSSTVYTLTVADGDLKSKIDTTNLSFSSAKDTVHIKSPEYGSKYTYYTWTHHSEWVHDFTGLDVKDMNLPFELIHSQNTQIIFRAKFDILKTDL